MLTWSLAILYMVNAFWFVLRASDPVIQADGWHFLDVFVRKAIEGHLHFADFFVKRSVDDHAQPLFKLILLFEWRYFDLDDVVGAVMGVFAAIACALIFHGVLMRGRPTNSGNGVPLLAWAAICALLFTLGGVGMWVWPLVVLENITILVILVFLLAVWHAHRNQRYLLLVAATLVLGISSDDSAFIAVIAVLLGLLLMLRADPEQRLTSGWKIFAIIVVCEVLVRIGYAYLPGGAQTTHGHPLVPLLGVLIERLKEGGWWQWALYPLVLPVYYQSPLKPAHAHVWLVVQVIMGVLLLVAHVFFWRRALRGRYNLPVFMAVCMMLLSYGWVAGIILWRVSAFGNDYLEQPRYVLLYAEQLIALLLIWAGAHELRSNAVTSRRELATGWHPKTWVPLVGALLLLVVQVPQSIAAWRMPKYEWAYYAKQATEIDALARDPVHTKDCELVNPVCGSSPEIRRDLTQLLSANRLNVYSSKVQRWHPYLPALTPVVVGSAKTALGTRKTGAN